MYQWCEIQSRRGKNTNLTAQKSNFNTVWFNFQTYIYIRLKIKPNSVRIRFLSCAIFVLPSTYIYVWKLNQTVLELDFWVSNFCSSLDGIWTHTIDTLQHHSLSLTSSALDHSTTSLSLVTLRSSGTDILYGCHLLLDVCIIYFISCDCIMNSSLSYTIY